MRHDRGIRLGQVFLLRDLFFSIRDAGARTWVPGNPANGTDALTFNVEAGKEKEVPDRDELFADSRIRNWAASATQKWNQTESADLCLVPERNDEGEHAHLASNVETFNFSSAKERV